MLFHPVKIVSARRLTLKIQQEDQVALTTGAVMDKLVEALKGQAFEIISTNLPQEKEDELRAAFGAE